MMKSLDHPNICKLLETYDEGRYVYLVMERCEGGELFARIMEHGFIDEHTTADIVRQVASALKLAHSKNIAHRDLKPENICFCSADPADNHVKVIDWGVGRSYGGLVRMKSSVGTLSYAAPEVLQAEKKGCYTSACDLWSLGVVAYVMLCGKPPFWGSSGEQLKSMVAESFPMAGGTWKGVSDDAKQVLRGLFKCDPKQRLSIDDILTHPWLQTSSMCTDPAVAHEVLTNLRHFSQTTQFFSVCAASVARQLDHRSLRDVHRVFRDMDTNRDGVLQLQEVKAGFEKIFGKGSEHLKEVEEVFARLDIDGSGAIDYTEFCAAGIGMRLSEEEPALWAAFKVFDVHDDDGRVTKNEVKEVLANANLGEAWSKNTLDEITDDLFAKFDIDGDGALDFEEWRGLMRTSCGGGRADPEPGSALVKMTGEASEKVTPLFSDRFWGIQSFAWAYGLLAESDCSDCDKKAVGTHSRFSLWKTGGDSRQ